MRRLIFLLSFFAYSGYYVGLAIIYATGLRSLSRIYSLPLRISLGIIAMLILVRHIKNIFTNPYKKYITLFIIFWFIYFIKVLMTQNSVLPGELARNWVEYPFYSITFVILPFLAFASLPFKKYKNDILNGFIYAGVMLGILTTYLYGSLLVRGIGRLNLITYETGEDVLNPLSLSYSGAVTIILCLYKLIILKVPPKEKIILWAGIIFGFIMFLLGSSRGSVVALLLTLPLFILYSPAKKKIQLTFLAFLAVPVIAWAITASGSSIIERIGGTAEDEGGGRGTLWDIALDHFFEYPIFGGRIEIGGIYPHNFVIEILMATGIVGFLFILPVLIKGFVTGRRRVIEDKENLFVYLILMQGFVQHFFTAGFYTSTLLFIPIAMFFSMNFNADIAKKQRG